VAAARTNKTATVKAKERAREEATTDKEAAGEKTGPSSFRRTLDLAVLAEQHSIIDKSFAASESKSPFTLSRQG